MVTRFEAKWQARSSVKKFGSFALALLAAACAQPARRPVTTIAPPPVVKTEPVKAPPLPQATEQNRVALLVPLTGANAAVGQSLANAANMALLDAGDKRINLRIYDTGPGAAQAAAKAVADGSRLFLGPLLAGDVRAVQSVAAANNIPVISFSNDISLAGADVFVMGFRPADSVARVVAYARSHGIERFAALVPAGVYGQRASTAFLRAVEASGGRSVAVVSYTHDPKQMLDAARRVTNYDARMKGAGVKPVLRPDGTVVRASAKTTPVAFQALLIADSGTVAGQMMPTLTQFGAGPGSAIVLGTELWNTEPGLANARSLKGALFAAVPDDRFKSLATRYRARFNATPSRLASMGYDSVLLVNSLAGNWRYGTPFPKGALANPQGFAGIDGVFRFTAGGVAERALEVQQIGAGTIVTVSAAPKAF